MSEWATLLDSMGQWAWEISTDSRLCRNARLVWWVWFGLLQLQANQTSSNAGFNGLRAEQISSAGTGNASALSFCLFVSVLLFDARNGPLFWVNALVRVSLSDLGLFLQRFAVFGFWVIFSVMGFAQIWGWVMSLFASGVVGWTDLLLYNFIQAVHDFWSPITVQFRITTLYLPFYLPNIFVIISNADCLQCRPSLVLSQCQVFVSILDHFACKFVAWSTIYPNTLNPKMGVGKFELPDWTLDP